MKIETNIERTQRIIAEQKTLGNVLPNRTLPKGYQWNGLNQPGCGAAKRRLRQMEKLQAKKEPMIWHATADQDTCEACAAKDNLCTRELPPHPNCTSEHGCRCTVTKIGMNETGVYVTELP